jgi:hypothetical protein
MIKLSEFTLILGHLILLVLACLVIDLISKSSTLVFMKPIILLGLSIIGIKGFSQTHKDTLNMLIGKWIVCEETKLIPNYSCTSGIQEYEFTKDSTFKEKKKSTSYGLEYSTPPRWSLSGRTLTMGGLYKDDVKNVSTSTLVSFANIIWLDRNNFYSRNDYGASGGIKYYYFKRK